MPSQNNSRAPARFAISALALAVSLVFTTPDAHAAGLGRLSVQSALGQPLRAEVEVTSVSREEAASLAVRLASQSAFRQANLDFNPALSALRFNLERRGDNVFVVRVTSLQPVNEPYLDVLLELTWATGRVLREYTVLLDPPALRATPDVVPPVAAPVAPVAATPPPAPEAASPAPAPVTAEPQPAASTPAPAPAPAAPQPARTAPAPVGVGDVYTVKSGDTLGKIAARAKPDAVSLDQMLVALYRANPDAFVNNNMNRLRSGTTLLIPDATEAQGIAPQDARREVAAQSADFAQYRARLAQVATTTPAVGEAPAQTASGQGRVTTKVEDQSATGRQGDQLQIAKADSGASAAAAAKAKQDEEVAKQRALKEQEERAAALKKSNEQIKKALEVQSKTGTQVQGQAESAKKAEPAKAEPPKTEPTPAPAPVAVAPAPAPEPAKVEPAPAPPPVQAEAPKPAPEEKKAEAPPAAPGPGFFDGLMSQTTLLLVGALVALGALLAGLTIWRRKRVEKNEEFRATGDSLRGNSLFGQTGGQSVDTGATSTFNSSFIPAASQLDSNEVDPVAEADVYIAYGREEQAEDILKEALRVQPDRHPVRVKLLEIYSRRGDKASFNAVADELRSRTGGAGEDWERAMKLGRSLDPSNPIYAGAGADSLLKGPTTELRLNPNTGTQRPATLTGAAAVPVQAPAAAPARSSLMDDFMVPAQGAAAGDGFGGGAFSMDARMSDTAMPVDTRLSTDSLMPLDTVQTQDTVQEVPRNAAPAFQASFPSEPAKPATLDPLNRSAAADAGADFASLDFDLTPTKTPVIEPATPTPVPVLAPTWSANTAAPEIARSTQMPTQPTIDSAALDFELPTRTGKAPAPTTVAGRSLMPDVDLDLPPTPAAPVRQAPPPIPLMQESLSRPSLLGEVGALPDEQAPRLTSNTDQATVPLIDFDLTGSDVELGGRRTETQAGSPLAAQMATKLDLARGYIDLGVKDGARELLEEVMRDGTRDQRQSAVDLLKQVEA